MVYTKSANYLEDYSGAGESNNTANCEDRMLEDQTEDSEHVELSDHELENSSLDQDEDFRYDFWGAWPLLQQDKEV